MTGIGDTLPGVVLTPDDQGYAEATRSWNGMVDKRPAVVVQPGSAAEVAAAVRHAAESGLPLSVRGGGHHIAGTSLVDGGLTIDLSRLTGVEVDPVARTATVGAGCRLRDVDLATQQQGLAVPLGFISNVGVGGLTLGGGLGYLTRRFGWTVDNLLEVEIVTADGQVRRANADEHPDLFWGVRGAGANLGVVTRLVFQLHQVGPTVHGGLVAWPFERAPEVMAAYRRITAQAPRELAVWLVLLHGPPAPFVPTAWHGRKLCAMAVCYSGDQVDAAAALAPIRALAEPVFDLIGEMPYTAVQAYLDDTEPVGMHYHWRTEYLATLDDELLDTLRDVFQACPNPMADVGILHLAGALNERAEDDGAVGNRDARYVIGVKGMWTPGDPDEPRFQEWVRLGGERIRPYGTGRTYVNFQTADEPDARVRAAYGQNYARLAALKHRYDPENLFRSNRNVTPVPAR
jgi:FAD/FMN-containing dehydrogenase